MDNQEKRHRKHFHISRPAQRGWSLHANYRITHKTSDHSNLMTTRPASNIQLGYYSGFRTLGMGILVLARDTMGGTGQEIRFHCREELDITCITLLATSSIPHFIRRIFGKQSLRTAG